MTAGYVEFEFDLPDALLKHLIEIFARLQPAALNPTFVSEIPEEQGVYQIFLDGHLVYVGKTDAEAGLNKRLSRHSLKVLHRSGLDPARLSFKAVRVFVFTAVDLETQLIKHYGGGKVVKWNGSGFGSNDVGRERDTTRYKEEHFDSQFPIDVDRPLPDFDLPATATAAAIFSATKEFLPYTFRFQNKGGKSRTAHDDLTDTMVTVSPARPLTARSIISQVVAQLPSGWQATMLPSHIILYKEVAAYTSGTILARSP